MKPSVCIPVEELARVRQLAADAPERLHVEECPRCRARALALSEFEHAGASLPPEADSAGTGSRLDAFIDQIDRGPAPRASREGASFWSRLLSPALRPAFAALVVVLAAGSFWFATRTRDRQELRGDSSASFAVGSPRATPEGWELAWAPMAGADEYAVLFFGPDLRERARVGGLHEPRLALRRDALPAGVAPGQPTFWQVVAYRAGDPIAESTTAALRLP